MDGLAESKDEIKLMAGCASLSRPTGYGLVLAQAPDEETIIYARLDHDRLKRLRRELPCLKHRRLK